MSPMVASGAVNLPVKTHGEQAGSRSGALQETSTLAQSLHAKRKLFSPWLNPWGSKEPRASRGRSGGGKHELIFTEIGVRLQQQIP